jgi:hypothetical protein
VESIPADMVARHEFEIDTTRAVEAWEAEVADNLAARQASASEASASEAGASEAGASETRATDQRASHAGAGQA